MRYDTQHFTRVQILTVQNGYAASSTVLRSNNLTEYYARIAADVYRCYRNRLSRLYAIFFYNINVQNCSLYVHVNGDIQKVWHTESIKYCQCQRARQAISPLVIFAVIDVSRHKAVNARVSCNLYTSICCFITFFPVFLTIGVRRS